MDFGIPIKPDIAIGRILNLTRQAEISGFSYGWIFDSHVIWKEPFPLLTLIAPNTKKMSLGPCATIPAGPVVPFPPSWLARPNRPPQGPRNWASGAAIAPAACWGKNPPR